MIPQQQDDVAVAGASATSDPDSEIGQYVEAHRELERAESAGSLPGASVDALGQKLLAEFHQAEQERQETELRWLSDLRQYKGKYDPDVEEKIGKRSKAFVRKTRVKVKTINSRVADLLFPAGSEKNWVIGPTPKPNIDMAERQRIEAGMQEQAAQAGQQVTPSMVDQAILNAARDSAKRMSTAIEDQLAEARYKEESLMAVHSGHLYGTGILKGPLVERKVRTRFRHEVVDEPVLGPDRKPLANPDGSPLTRKVQRWAQYTETYVVPFVECVPLWRFFPDMSVSKLHDCRFVYELHTMPRHKVSELASRPSFRRERIVNFLKSNPRGAVVRTQRHYDTELKSLGDRQATQSCDTHQYEVLERWGWLDGAELRQCGVDVPAEREHESFFANIWTLPDGQVIRAVLQPINGVTWPYHLYHFDKDETSLFGEGLASVMRDDQAMLNAAVRLMLDNAAITAGPQLEVAIGLLHAMEDIDEVVPWRIWKRNAQHNDKQAIRAIELPSRLNELSALAKMFEANTDETTAIPRYMSGENATQGAAGTAAGMSMLMAAANIVIKDLINSWDEGVMRPFLTALYHWNMQFNPDNTIKGDFDVKARGTASLIAKEVRARQLNEFAAMASDPQDAPFVKRHKLLLARAEANELSDVVKTEDEVQAEQGGEEAQKAREMQQQLAQAQVEEAIGKARRMSAEAELAAKRIDELEAKISLMATDEMVKKVEAVYAALQAGGVATRDPLIAPAADEILKSSAFRDANGDPSIAQLNGPPVQPQQGTQVLLSRGQSIAPDPRAPMQPADASPADASPPMADANAPTGMVGRRAGIETERIEA